MTLSGTHVYLSIAEFTIVLLYYVCVYTARCILGQKLMHWQAVNHIMTKQSTIFNYEIFQNCKLYIILNRFLLLYSLKQSTSILPVVVMCCSC